MTLSDIVQPVAALLFPQNSETEHAVNALHSAVLRLNRHLKIFQKKVSQIVDHAAEFDVLREIKQLLKDFPVDNLDSLAVSIGNQYRDEFTLLYDELLALIDQLDADIEEQIRQNAPRSLETSAANLDALQVKFETFFKRYHKKKRCGRFLPYLLYMLPLALGYVAGIYLVFNDGVYPVSQEVINPESAYHLVTGDTDLLALSDQYNNQFWHNFSLYYFGRETNQFEANRNIELKFLLKNKAASASYLVSTISAEVQRIEAKPFPWEKVIVTPNVRATSQGNGVVFKDAGIGPALDFSCTGKTKSGMLSFTKIKDFLYKDELSLQFDEPVEQVGIALVDKGRLRDSLFLQLQSKDHAKGPGEVFQVEGDGAWYETVETLERLKQITTVSYKEELMLTWQYRSLRQEAHQDTIRLTLPETQAYYAKVETLRKGDPRVMRAELSEGMRQDSKVQALQVDQARELIRVLQGEEPHVLKGIDLINQHIKLNTSNLEPNHTASNIENVDTILNPSGYVILYLTLDSPENGSYQVRVSINGNEVKRINIDALIPYSYTFDINDPVSLQRFHANSASHNAKVQ